MLQNKIHLCVKSRNKIYFEDDVYSVTSSNDKGVFDVLPFHANFISIIRDFIKIDKGDVDNVKFEIKSGIMYVESNIVNIYVKPKDIKTP